MKETAIDKIFGIGSILLGFLLGATTESGFNLGKSIFRFFGVASWANGQSGLFYPGILALILIVLGLAVTLRRFGFKRLIIVILLGNLLAPPLVTWGRETYLEGLDGLDAIEYNRKTSRFDISAQSPSDMIQIKGTVTLTNFSNEQVSFSLKLCPKDYEKKNQHGWFREDITLYKVNTDGSASLNLMTEDLFVLEPGETRRLQVYSAIPNFERFSSMTGMLSGPDLLLADGQEEKYFKT